ncbi:MAG: type II toxin-antitoxin system PemK/MazF family toxin [Dermatophilaceae bacterium]
MTDLPARGDVWWCEPAEIGRRPVVVLSRDAVIPRHRRALVAPCTTTIRNLASEVLLEPGDDPVPLRSAVNLDSVESVSIAILVERLGRVADARMREICAALAVAVDYSG